VAHPFCSYNCKYLSELKKHHQLRLPDVKCPIIPWSMFVISSALTCSFNGNVPLLHTSTQCPDVQVHHCTRSVYQARSPC